MYTRASNVATTKPKLIKVHVRLFTDDVKLLKARALQNGLPWNIELRQLVRRALRGEVKDFFVVK